MVVIVIIDFLAFFFLSVPMVPLWGGGGDGIKLVQSPAGREDPSYLSAVPIYVLKLK